MQKVYLFIVAIFALIATSCEEEYEPRTEFSDVAWMHELRSNGAKIALNDYLNFSDLSQGTVKHQWSVSDTSGILYLEGAINRTDKTYEQFIKEDQPAFSTDKTIHLLYTKPGIQTVRLYNEWTEEVTFRGADTITAEYDSARGVYFMDKTFEVEVYDTIQPAIDVFYDGKPVLNLLHDQFVSLADSADWPEVEVKSGESLKFVNKTTIGQPTDFTWTFSGGAPTTSKNAEEDVTYFKLGRNIARLALSRSGENIPSGSKTTYVPLIINVVKSTLPFGAQVAKQQEDGSILLTLNAEVVKFTGEEDNFTVTVNNADAGVTDKVINVAQAVRGEALNTIKLVLEEKIYANDVVTISYTDGNIQSVDQRTMEDLVNAPLSMFNRELLKDTDSYGFEAGSIDALTELGVLKPAWGSKGEIEVVSDKAASGTYSLKMTAKGNDDNFWPWMITPGGIALKAGKTYEFSYKVFIPESNEYKTNYYAGLIWDHAISGSTDYTAIGEWVEKSMVISMTADKEYQIKFRMGTEENTPLVDNPGEVTGSIYYDDFSIVEVDERPVAAE